MADTTFRNGHVQQMAIANTAVLTAKSNTQIKKPVTPLLKITSYISYLALSYF